MSLTVFRTMKQASSLSPQLTNVGTVPRLVRRAAHFGQLWHKVITSRVENCKDDSCTSSALSLFRMLVQLCLLQKSFIAEQFLYSDRQDL